MISNKALLDGYIALLSIKHDALNYRLNPTSIFSKLPQGGICAAMKCYSVDRMLRYDIEDRVFKNQCYPVHHPSFNKNSTAFAFTSLVQKWTGEYGDNRLKLLDKCIAYVRKRLSSRGIKV